jgi:hypothetical protein
LSLASRNLANKVASALCFYLSCEPPADHI